MTVWLVVGSVGWVLHTCAVRICVSCSPCSLSCHHYHFMGLAHSLTDFCQKSVYACNDMQVK